MNRLLVLAVVLSFCASPAFADTVLITGCDRGLGLEFAKQYAAKGWIVIATALKPSADKELNELAATNKNVTVDKLDVTSDSDIAAIAAKYRGKPIDLLLNNAGVLGNAHGQMPGSFDQKEFLQVMMVNVYGPLALSAALRENVAISKGKKIVSVSSGIGSISSTERIGSGPYFYRISKAALDMAMRSLAVDLKAQGIVVGVVSPSPTATAMTANYSEDFGGGAGGTIGMHRSTPEESVAKVIPVIAGLNAAKANQGINTADGPILPW